jgi:hypothetical protein
MLNDESCKIIITGKDIVSFKDTIEGSLFYPLGKEIKLSSILDMISKLKEGNYKFTDLSLKGGAKEFTILNDSSVAMDNLLIKAIVILLEAIYAPSFKAGLTVVARPLKRDFCSFPPLPCFAEQSQGSETRAHALSNTREFALRELKFRLRGAK